MGSVEYGTIRKPFLDHLHELRRRLVWCALALAIGSAVGFGLHEQLLAFIQKPLGETLYFTSPTGGFNFIFKLSLTFGFIVALPVIMYHAIRFLSPIVSTSSLKVTTYTLWSLALAYAGVAFAYVVSLPAALRFLTNFGGSNIQALITADEYFSFALAYLGGFALLFQIPLVMLVINRITPQKPSNLMGAQRYIILGSFIVAAILTPTPDPFNQLIMALPIISLYQIGVILVWMINRQQTPTINGSFVDLSEQALADIQQEIRQPIVPTTKPRIANLNNPQQTRPKFVDITPQKTHQQTAYASQAYGASVMGKRTNVQVDMITS